MINTYGLPMIGLEDAAKATVNWPDRGYCSIIRYDPEDGKVWCSEATTDQLAGKFDVFRTARHVSAQRIADEIAEHMRRQSMTPQARYDADNTVRVTLKLNRKTDADIIAQLEKQPNKQGYIKSAIRASIARDSN